MRNPRIGDVLTGVVLEMPEDVRTTVRGLIRFGIGYTVLDGIAIDQRDAIVSRGRDKVTVGSLFDIISCAITTGIGQVVGIGSCALGSGGL